MSSEKRSKLKIDGVDDSQRWDDVFRLMSWWDSDRMASATVMVVGAGALGNEVLKNLALLNVGQILIVDFDTIEYSNLSRSALFRPSDANQGRLKSEVAAQRIREINPHLKVKVISGDIGVDVGLGVFRRMDVIIGCLDNRLARLHINRNCFRVGKVWVDGAIENLAGQLNVYKPGISCYECQLTESEWSNIRFKMGCPDVARRNKSAGRIPTTPISASIIGALQVQEALKIIYGNERQSMAGETFQYEGMNNMVLMYASSPLKELCDSHYEIQSIVEAETLSNSSSIGDIIAWCQNEFKTKSIRIQLDHELVLELGSKSSDQLHAVLKAKPHLSDLFLQQFQDHPSEELFITRSVGSLDAQFEHLDLPASDLGIPPLQVLQVETDEDIFFVELTGDEAFLSYN